MRGIQTDNVVQHINIHIFVVTGRKFSGGYLSRVEDDLQGVLLHVGVWAGQELD